ncbi:MAG: putative rane protein [Proteobacteria bacterium]|nr:putative rane protein [Pseudomonadota bacterium]
MGMTETDYLEQLKALLPLGPAWPKDDAALLTRFLGGLSAELARVDSRAWQLLEEADPRTTAELFLDWERVAGLPDACAEAFGGPQTMAQRRAALIGKLTTIGGQSAAYFIALAASLGYAITITEFELHDVEDNVEHPLYGAPWQFAWQVNAAEDTVGVLAVTDTVEDPLAWWGNELLECVINRLKPAHTLALFAYT